MTVGRTAFVSGMRGFRSLGSVGVWGGKPHSICSWNVRVEISWVCAAVGGSPCRPACLPGM